MLNDNRIIESKKELYVKVKTEIEEYANLLGVKDFENRYCIPNIDRKKGSNKNNYFYLFCEHFVDRQYMKNIIKFYDKKTQSLLDKVMLNYDLESFLNRYKSQQSFKDSIKIADIEGITNRSEWIQFIDAIYLCAKYLSNECIDNQHISIEDLLKYPTDDDDFKRKIYALRIIKNNIPGLGPAVTYNWIKECGAEWLAKPDLHITRIVNEILKYDIPQQEEFKFPDSISKKYRLSKEEYIVYYIYRWVNDIKNIVDDKNITPFKLDRLLFLYCTGGYFYLESERKTLSEAELLEKTNILFQNKN